MGNIFLINEYFQNELDYSPNYNFKSEDRENCIDLVTMIKSLTKVKNKNSFIFLESLICNLKNFLECPFTLTVFDNNDLSVDHQKESFICQNLCKKYDICYIKLPQMKGMFVEGWYDGSHALANNFIYKKFLKNRFSKYVGFIEPDVFLNEKVNFLNIFQKDYKFIGLPKIGSLSMNYKVKPVSLHPCLLVFDKDYISNFSVDFMPIDNYMYPIEIGTGFGWYWTLRYFINEDNYKSFIYDISQIDYIHLRYSCFGLLGTPDNKIRTDSNILNLLKCIMRYNKIYKFEELNI